MLSSKGGSESSLRPLREEVNPTDGVKVESPCEIFVAGAGDDERLESWMSSTEFEQAGKVPALESCALDLCGPRTPTAFDHGIHFQRLFAPVGDPLSAVHGEGEAGVLDPRTNSRRVTLLVRRTVGMHRGEQGIIERDQLGWGRSPTEGACGELLKAGNEIRVLEQGEIVSHRLEGASIGELTLGGDR